MGTFTSLTDGMDTSAIDTISDIKKTDLESLMWSIILSSKNGYSVKLFDQF